MMSFQALYKCKESFSLEECRRNREEVEAKLRRDRKQDKFCKRRNLGAALPGDKDGESVFSELLSDTNFCEKFVDISGLDLTRLDVISLIRKCTFSPDFASWMVEHGSTLISMLCRILADPTSSDEITYETSWIFTNLTMESRLAAIFVQNNMLQIMDRLLEKDNLLIVENAAWTVSNIAADQYVFRDQILESSIPSKLIKHLHSGRCSASLTDTLVWCVSNLCQHGRSAPRFSLVAPFLPALADLIAHTSNSVIYQSLLSIGNLSNGPNVQIQAVLDTGISRNLVALLSNNDDLVRLAALRVVGNMLTGSDHQTQRLVSCGVLDKLVHFLADQRDHVKKEACWALSNVTAGNPAQIQAVLDCGAIAELIKIIWNSQFKLRKEATWAISNACIGGSASQIGFLVAEECIPALCDMLTCKDLKVIAAVLDAIHNILKFSTPGAGGDEQPSQGCQQQDYAVIVEECRGLDKIEYLQMNDNAQISERAQRIVSKFFAHLDDLAGDMDVSCPGDVTAESNTANVDNQHIAPFPQSTATASNLAEKTCITFTF